MEEDLKNKAQDTWGLVEEFRLNRNLVLYWCNIIYGYSINAKAKRLLVGI